MKRETEYVTITLLICLVMTVMLPIIPASECNGSPPILNVEYTEETLLSPGYPRHYNNNMDCVWIFQATHNKTAGFGIQIATSDLDLDPDLEATTLDLCDTDYLELYEGTPSHLGPRVGIWCGKDKKVFKSTSDTITLKFHSHGHHTGTGFAVEYSLVNVASSECRPGNVTHMYAGRAPLYVGFTANTKSSRCIWTIEAIDNTGATDASSALVVQALSIPQLWCKDGHFILFDGPDTTSPQVIHWCNGAEAFSVIHLSTNFATLIFAFTGLPQSQSGTLQLKLYSRSQRFQQTCSDAALPQIHVTNNPVYFQLPILDVKGTPCSVVVSQEIKNNLLRIDVIHVNGHLPTCTSEAITVQRALGDKTQVEKSCNRRQYPMYLPMVASAVVSSSDKVLLRAVSADPTCSGVSFAKLATTSLLMEDTLPRGFRHGVPAQNCISKYLITTEKESLAVALWLRWTKPDTQKEHVIDSNICLGDFVHVYDGKTEESPLLFSTCHTNNRSDLTVETRVIGTGNNMLVLFESDDVADSSFVQIVYYAVPRNIHCSTTQEITVTTDAQELTSPSYPHFYPLDYDCTYKLTTKNAKDVIVIEVEHAEFSRPCESIIHMYYVDANGLHKNYPRHLCDRDKNKKFISNQNQFVLEFKSLEFGLPGRWKLNIYSLATGRAAGSHFRDNEYAIVVILLLVICLLGFD